MKKYIPYIIAGIAILVLCVNSYRNSTSFEDFRKEEKAKSDRKIDSIQKENILLEESKKAKETIADSLEARVIELEGKIQNLKSRKDEKINAINGYTPGELQQYFTDHYPTDDK